MGAFGLTELETFWDRQLDTKALLGWSADTAVLAFRGTPSITNACSDLKARPPPWPAPRVIRTVLLKECVLARRRVPAPGVRRGCLRRSGAWRMSP